MASPDSVYEDSTDIHAIPYCVPGMLLNVIVNMLFEHSVFNNKQTRSRESIHFGNSD